MRRMFLESLKKSFKMRPLLRLLFLPLTILLVSCLRLREISENVELRAVNFITEKFIKTNRFFCRNF